MNLIRQTALVLIACGGLGYVTLEGRYGPGADFAPLPGVPPPPGAPAAGASPAASAAPSPGVGGPPVASAAPAPAPLDCPGVPLASASPTAARGDAALRQAAHRGLEYLAKSSRQWTEQHGCFGCHVQAVTMEALSAGQHHHYDVAKADLDAMVKALELGVTAGGRVTGVAFEGAAWARYDRWVDGAHTEDLLKYAAELVTLQAPSGAIPDDDARRPITGGTMQTTYQAAQTWRQAHARTADEKWLLPLRRAETFLATTAAGWEGPGADLQDLNFALLGLAASGAGRTEASSLRLQEMLLGRQRSDGGWSLEVDGASDAFATGQTLYALKMAGFGDAESPITRGLSYLLARQDAGGSWRTYRSGQGGAEKGETMWAVLGLVTVDVTSVNVAGLTDGQHVAPKMPIEVTAVDNGGGGIAKLELSVDDLPLHAACGNTLAHTWDTAALSEGLHVVEVVATNAKGQQSRRRFEVYAGNVQLTHVAAEFDENKTQTIVTLRNIAGEGKGTIGFEVWSASEGDNPVAEAKVFTASHAAVPGPMSFAWAGEADDGKLRGRGRYYARVSYRGADGVVRQTASALFFHDRAEVQAAQYAEVEGQLSLENGARGSGNTVVELVDGAGNVVQTTRTTDQGNYRFKNVSEGGYKVRTRKAGFQALESAVSTRRGAKSAASMTW